MQQGAIGEADGLDDGVVVSVTFSRRRVVVAAVTALVAAVLPTSGCALLENDPAPLVPFTDFVVRESGGVDGRNNPLLVSTDGTALLLGRDGPAAGQLAPAKVSRLKTLLESKQFRREAANPSRENSRTQCSDVVSVTIEMGALRVGRGHTCSEGEEKAPAYSEILGLLSDARNGTFDQGVSDQTPPLPEIRLDRTGFEDDPDLTITVSGDGVARLTTKGSDAGTPRQETLDTEQFDALRVVLSRELAERVPTGSCDDTAARYTFEQSGQPAVTLKACNSRPPSIGAAIRILEQTFDLD